MAEFKVTINVEGSNDKESISKMVGILTKELSKGVNKSKKLEKNSLYGEFGKGIKIDNIDYPGEVILIEGGKLAILNVGENVPPSNLSEDSMSVGKIMVDSWNAVLDLNKNIKFHECKLGELSKSTNEIGEALKSVLPDKYKPLKVLEHYSKQAIESRNYNELNKVLKSLEKYLLNTPTYRHHLDWLDSLRYKIEESINIEDRFYLYDLKLTAIITVDRILNNGQCIIKVGKLD